MKWVLFAGIYFVCIYESSEASTLLLVTVPEEACPTMRPFPNLSPEN